MSGIASMFQAEHRENGVIQIAGAAHKYQRITVGRIEKCCVDARLNVCADAYFNHVDRAIWIERGVMCRKQAQAAIADGAHFLFAQIADDQCRDQILSLRKGIHHQQDNPVFWGQQRTHDIHSSTSVTVITESEKGLGIPGEVVQPTADDDLQPIDMSKVNQTVIVHEDGGEA